MKSLLLGILSFLFLTSCNQTHKVEHVERAFYYWKSSSSLRDINQDEIRKQKLSKLYVKQFEIDFSETMGNFPYEKNFISEYEINVLDSIKIIPTVFIRNEIFQYNTEKSLELLADNITFLIAKRSMKNESTPVFKYDEIQIDCDWTKTTKDKYFYLLKQIKEKSKKELSCTLRLYPYKYPEIMGVPPVDKVMLMCYNLIKPLTRKNENSILDNEELKKYLNKPTSYPLHIDVALPVFYWTQLYQNSRFTQLLDITDKDFATFTKPIKPLWYEVIKDTTISWNTYLRKGDQIKFEDVKKEQIDEAITIIKKNVKLDKSTTICLFDLDVTTFKKYSHEEITGFYSAFTK